MTITEEYVDDDTLYLYVVGLDNDSYDQLLAFMSRTYPADGRWGIDIDPCTHLSMAALMWFTDHDDAMLVKTWMA